MKTAVFGLLIGLALVVSNSRAEEPKKQPASVTGAAPKKKDAVLDFEGELIEGQRKTPELLLQQEMGNLSVETILFQRSDFNDFHSVDGKRRPRLYKGLYKGK